MALWLAVSFQEDESMLKHRRRKKTQKKAIESIDEIQLMNKIWKRNKIQQSKSSSSVTNNNQLYTLQENTKKALAKTKQIVTSSINQAT